VEWKINKAEVATNRPMRAMGKRRRGGEKEGGRKQDAERGRMEMGGDKGEFEDIKPVR
jgi:hypothetical protein